ncbi:LpqB family beta-propeller domain-containing protein [Streptomyces sp. ZYX-F-203]
MPDSGDPRDVTSVPRPDAQVRVFALPPAEGASPTQIVQGFLEALTSDDPGYETAREYLTPEAEKTWRPEWSTTVLADGPGTASGRSVLREDTTEYALTLTGTHVATVDEARSYSPAEGAYEEKVRLVRDGEGGEWRIDALPQGVVLGRADFQRNFLSVNKYYLSAADRPVGAGSTARSAEPAAVADPVYVRRRVEPMVEVVTSLLEGPSGLPASVVRSGFPDGTALARGTTSLTPDDEGRLTVTLDDRAAGVDADTCAEMAAQTLFTLRGLTPTVEEVRLRAGGTSLCSLTGDRAETVAARGSAGQPHHLYLVDDEHRVVRIPAGGTTAKPYPVPVPGALGEGSTALRSVAVSRDEDVAAGVGLDGGSLYVSDLESGASIGEPVLVSRGAREEDRLTTPSWDAHGDLWIGDQDPDRPRLLLLREGTGAPREVRVAGLEDPVRAVRVAADGVRVALVVGEGEDRSLLIGQIEPAAHPEDPPTVVGLRSAAPQLEEVTAMSWAGDSRLVVVGRGSGGVQQIGYVQVDGSTPETSVPAALTGVREIAATEGEGLPLVAYSEDGIVRLPSGMQWQKVTAGTAPVYPG